MEKFPQAHLWNQKKKRKELTENLSMGLWVRNSLIKLTEEERRLAGMHTVCHVIRYQQLKQRESDVGSSLEDGLHAGQGVELPGVALECVGS